MSLLNLSPAKPTSGSSASASVKDAAIKDVTIATFMADVIEASRLRPVIVDFWAPWCGPCKQLGPVLEKLVKDSKGAVSLAKVNIDQDPEIAQQMRIQSIPAVFAFFQGQPVDGFMGVQPEAQVKAWVDQLIKLGGATEDGGPGSIEDILKQATALLEAGQASDALVLFHAVLEADPAQGEAYAGLVRCLTALGDLEKARAALDDALPDVLKHKAMEPARTALELAEQGATAAGGLAEAEARLAKDPDDHAARYDLALALYAQGAHEQAVEALLTIVKRQRGWNDEAARKQLLKIFEALGFNDPVAIDGRKKLSSLLFS